MELRDVKRFLEEVDQNDIVFDSHFYKRIGERPITERMIRSFLSRLNKLEKIEQGKGGRFKLWFRMSRKYSLIMIVEIDITDITKVLKVISAWNTDKKWQEKLKQ